MSILAFLFRMSIICCSSRSDFSVRSSFYLTSARQGRETPFKSSITCIASKDNRLLPSVAVRIKSFLVHHNYRFVATQAKCSEQDSLCEELKRVLLAAADNPISTMETCNTLIEKLCRSKNLSDASHLLKGLHDKQMYLNSNTYKLLLAAAAEANDFELSSLVFKDLLLTTKSQDSTSYIYVARAFQKMTDSAPLLKLIREISELTFPRSATAINRIIFGFSVSGQIDKALLIFEDMKTLKCKPDTVTFNIVLDILGKAGWVDRMLCEYASMKASNCDPDIVTYYTLINNSRKMGRLDMLLNIIREMVKRGIEPDLRTYTALIDGFGRSGNVEDALNFYSEMKRRQVRPSIYIYRVLISNLKKAGKCELARILSEEVNMHVSELVCPKDFRWKNR